MQEAEKRSHPVSELIDLYAAYKEHDLTLASLKGCVDNLQRLIPDDLRENWHLLPSRLRLQLAHFAPATRRQKLGHVRLFLQFCAIFHGVDPRAPALLKLPHDPPPDPRVLSHQECRDVLQFAFGHSPRAALYVALCLYHGLRRSEALGVHGEDLDLAEGILYVRWREGYRLKTHSSSRQVPIPSAATPLLAEAIYRRPRGPLFERSKWWPAALGLPHGASATIFRHTYASALVSGRYRDDAGALCMSPARPDYWQVSRFLGHSGVNTLRHYAGKSDGIPALDPAELAMSKL